MSQPSNPIPYAPLATRQIPGKFLLALPLLLFILSAILFILLWIRNDFVPIHRNVLGTNYLTYFSAATDDFLNLWTPIFFGLTLAGCIIAVLTLRSQRNAVAWFGLILNVSALITLVTFAVTASDYPRVGSFFFPYDLRQRGTSPAP